MSNPSDIDYTDDGLINTLDEFQIDDYSILDSWLDNNGIRHIIVRDGNVELRYEWDAREKKMKALTDVF